MTIPSYRETIGSLDPIAHIYIYIKVLRTGIPRLNQNPHPLRSKALERGIGVDVILRDDEDM